ncbi:MAG: nicotinamide-nucleotide amidohydrolase family protein [Lachnospiraceae bacterium]|nr:nicotinamide-nucleotide amidohydrolase family protein [Lachnospiraceae bacterium]
MAKDKLRDKIKVKLGEAVDNNVKDRVNDVNDPETESGEDTVDNGFFVKYFKICGMKEKDVRSNLKDMLSAKNPKVSYEAVPGEVHIKLEARDEGDSSAKKLAKPLVKEIKNRFGLNIYTTDKDTTLEKAVVDLLKTNSLVLATCESCTGGMIASRIIDVPGASEVFKEGFVTYSNKAKRTRLGVKKGTLLKYGAVSEETAKEMVKGCATVSKANVTLSTTGIAGPDGGTEDKPVGLVYVGCNVCGKTRINKYNFDGDRMEIRQKATSCALSLLRTCILEYYSEKNFS